MNDITQVYVVLGCALIGVAILLHVLIVWFRKAASEDSYIRVFRFRFHASHPSLVLVSVGITFIILAVFSPTPTISPTTPSPSNQASENQQVRLPSTFALDTSTPTAVPARVPTNTPVQPFITVAIPPIQMPSDVPTIITPFTDNSITAPNPTVTAPALVSPPIFTPTPDPSTFTPTAMPTFQSTPPPTATHTRTPTSPTSTPSPSPIPTATPRSTFTLEIEIEPEEAEELGAAVSGARERVAGEIVQVGARKETECDGKIYYAFHSFEGVDSPSEENPGLVAMNEDRTVIAIYIRQADISICP